MLGGSLTNSILFCRNDIVSEAHWSMAGEDEEGSAAGPVLGRALSLREHPTLAGEGCRNHKFGMFSGTVLFQRLIHRGDH